MTQKKFIKLFLIVSLILISSGGFLLHSRIHTLQTNSTNYIPFIAGLLSLLLISTMFFFKPLIPFAYILNGIIVIIGTITMIHFSIVKFTKELTINNILLGTLLPDILILWSILFIGKLIFEIEITNVNNLDSLRHKGRFFRYPNFGYWLVHLAGLSIMYFLGNLLWK